MSLTFNYQERVNAMDRGGIAAAEKYASQFRRVETPHAIQEMQAQAIQAVAPHSSGQGNLPDENIYPELVHPNVIEIEEYDNNEAAYSSPEITKGVKEVKERLKSRGIKNASFLTAEQAIQKAQEMGI